jgi:hypothetical protein
MGYKSGSTVNPETEEFGVFWGDKIYSYTKEVVPIIEHLLYEQDVTCISAAPGKGKSILALQIVCALTSGEPFLDTYRVAKKCKVLYIQTEGSRAETISRLKCMKNGLNIDDGMWAHMNITTMCLDTVDGINSLISGATAPGIKFDVIVIDPLYPTVKGSLISDEVAITWTRNVRNLRSIFPQCTFLIINHEGKEMFGHDGQPIKKNVSHLFGSVFWSAFVNSLLSLSVKDGIHTLKVGKQRSGKIVESIDMIMKEPDPLMFVHCDDKVSTGLSEVERFIREAPEPVTSRDVCNAVTASKATVYRALSKAQKNKLVERIEQKPLPKYRWAAHK